jgi:hypothetical protein
MRWKRQDSAARSRLERLGREVVRSAAANDEEAEEVARSPFLYARVRARVAAERQRRAEGEGWLAVLGVAWRAVPALSLVFAVALALLLTSGPAGAPAQAGVVEEALAGARQGAVYESVVFAETSALSGDDVLTTIYYEDGPEGQR